VDTLRADHLSCYGYHLETSPNIDKLAAEGVRFENAHTSIPLTGPAHFSLFSSRFPQEIGARINGIAPAEGANALYLPQILRRFGYHNAAFISAWPLTSRLTHLDKWFDLYDEDLSRTYQLFNSQRYAEDVTPPARAWLEANKERPFFLWVHYFDPHSPYHLREGYEKLKQVGSPKPVPEDLRNGDARERIQKYDSEIAYADHHIGILLKSLDDQGLRDNTLVVLVADHGESLGEHDYVGHGRQLYEPIVRIPLIMRLPGKTTPGKVVKSKVSITDVTPTILDLTVRQEGEDLNIPVPFSGRSLAGSIDGGTDPEEQTVRYVTFAGKKGWMPKILADFFIDNRMPLKMGHALGQRKVIWTPQDKELEIFDIVADRLELKPAKPKPGSPQYRAERKRMKSWFESTDGASGENEMTKEDVKTLETLGYIQ